MKKFLLFFTVFACVSIGAWALPEGVTEGIWHYDATENQVEPVVVINNTAGNLKATLEGIPQSDYQVMVIKGEINEADRAVLSTITTATLDMQDVTWSTETKTFVNANVQNLILPDNWSKAEVNAVGAACANLGSCISQATNFQAWDSDNSSVGTYASITAYVKTGNTLETALRHVYYDNAPNTKLGGTGTVSRYDFQLSGVRSLTISGYPVARDLSNTGSDGKKFDENGHFVFGEEVIESAKEKETRTLVGTTQIGALNNVNQLVYLDLSDAIIPEENNADLTLSFTGIIGKNLKQLLIPTSPLVKTLPADFLNVSGVGLREICIPGNIEYIKTRAFQQVQLYHVWTTGNDETIRYDNGAVTDIDSEGNETVETGQVIPLTSNANLLYGSITLPPNLKLIESGAFGYATHIKDVYVLCLDAPECHVDAFNSVEYVANDACNPEKDENGNLKGGIITREAYVNNPSEYTWMTMLHYPRECTTPAIQRYTDPTRRYSVATGLRDGNGAVIYFPTQAEYCRAYLQGTFGYLWNAWDPTRNEDGSLSFLNTTAESSIDKDAGYYGKDGTNRGQQIANDAYISNTYEDIDKTDRVFYDTTDGGNLAKPDGQKNYWDVIWEGKQLYPKPVITYGDYIYVQDEEGAYVYDGNTYRAYNGTEDDGLTRYSRAQKQSVDEDGNLIYETCSEGNFIKDYSYVLNNEGDYVHDVTIIEDENGESVKDYSYVEDAEGLYCHEYYEASYSWGDTDTFYYLATEYIENENGEYLYVNGNYLTYEEGNSSNYDWWWNQGHEKTRYQKVTSYKVATDMYNSGQLYKLSTEFSLWTEEKGNAPRYTKVYSDVYRAYDETIDQGETRYNVTDNGYRAYNEETDSELERYNRVYSTNTYRAFNESIDDENETRYCPVLEDARIEIVEKANDYRGWHQFVLTGYGYMGTEELEPFRTYISDNDWWTICEPYDLTRAEMIKFFGNENGTTAAEKYPYLSRLLYVVRDAASETINLYFSKNLLNYTYEKGDDGHFVQTGEVENDDDIVLHAGVPYMIRPNRVIDAESGSFNLKFDIYKSTNPDLYQKLKDAEDMEGQAQMNLVLNGLYEVPAYEPAEDGTISITYPADTECTAKKCEDFTYTFVGSFYNSLLPQYAYFLGWDASKNRASFFYNREADTQNWRWANETAIIMANWSSAEGSGEIHKATSTKDPARWIITAVEGNNDDYVGSSANRSSLDIHFDTAVADGIKEISNVKTETTISNKVYNISGQYAGDSINGLAKGVYIKNGKKIIVK